MLSKKFAIAMGMTVLTSFIGGSALAATHLTQSSQVVYQGNNNHPNQQTFSWSGNQNQDGGGNNNHPNQ